MGNATGGKRIAHSAMTELERTLLERRRRLIERIHQGKSLTATRATQGAGDEADVAVDAVDHELGLRIAEIRSQEMVKVEEALQKIGEGTYGNCAWCGKRIPAARLLAMPAATLCVACQKEFERAEAEEGPGAGWDRIAESSREETPDRRVLREFAQG